MITSIISFLVSSGTSAERAGNAVATIGLLFFSHDDAQLMKMIVLQSIRLLTSFTFTYKNTGPAVLNGGVTTLIALVLLGFSTSHVFVTFFRSVSSWCLVQSTHETINLHFCLLYCRVFVLTVVFGLFHGLVLLPVLLAHLGPREPREEEDDLSLSKKIPPSPSSYSSSSASTSSSSIPTYLSSSADSSPSLSVQKH